MLIDGEECEACNGVATALWGERCFGSGLR